MSALDGLQYASQFELKSLVLIGGSGHQVDVREIMYELNLFEDVFTNTLTGNLLLSDTQNLINQLPIVGVEHLVVAFTKPSTNWHLEKVFRVYKISDRAKSAGAAETYLLHFCSEEMLLNEGIKISNSYKKASITAIIKDIAYGYLQIDQKKLPISEITHTFGTYDVVVPFWSPFYTINWLARMAFTSTSPSCTCVFFEDTQGFHFKSLEEMCQQNPIQTVNFMPLNMTGQSREKGAQSDMDQRLQSAESYELLRGPNLFRALSGAQYAGKLMRVNILDQQVKVSSLNGLEFFKSTKHLNPYPFVQPTKVRTDQTLTEFHEAYYRVMIDVNHPETWLLQRNAYLTGLHGFQLKVTLPGNLNLRAGQVVTLNFPAAQIGQKTSKPIDDLYSGNYLITAIRHKIDRHAYACILEVSKDSLKTQLAAPLDHNPTMKKLRHA